MKKYTYRTGGHGQPIEKFEVVQETKAFITYWCPFFGGTPIVERSAKRSSYYNFFDTFAEARQFLLARKDTEIANYKLRIENLISDRARIEKLQEEDAG